MWRKFEPFLRRFAGCERLLEWGRFFGREPGWQLRKCLEQQLRGRSRRLLGWRRQWRRQRRRQRRNKRRLLVRRLWGRGLVVLELGRSRGSGAHALHGRWNVRGAEPLLRHDGGTVCPVSRKCELHGARDVQHDDPRVHPVHDGRPVRGADALLLGGRDVRCVRWRRQLPDELRLRYDHEHVRGDLHDGRHVHDRSDAAVQHDDDALRRMPDDGQLRRRWWRSGPSVRHDDEYLRRVPDDVSVPRRNDLYGESRLHVSRDRGGT